MREEPVPYPSANVPAVAMFLMVGLPGAGKTTRAKELASANRALRLTPDEWMIPLFGDSMAGLPAGWPGWGSGQ
jgi:predicted kinase